MVAFARGGALLERERELEALRDGVDRACAGEGTLLLIEGPAGAGKTVLAREARAAAERAQMMPLQARGSELERPFAFGVVRQLLEPVISKERGHAELFAGAAGPAARLFDPGERRPLDAGAGFEALHSLYWLVVNMADQAPVLVLVDDCQWADVDSLRFLAHLAPPRCRRRRSGGVVGAAGLASRRSRAVSAAAEPVCRGDVGAGALRRRRNGGVLPRLSHGHRR